MMNYQLLTTTLILASLGVSGIMLAHSESPTPPESFKSSHADPISPVPVLEKMPLNSVDQSVCEATPETPLGKTPIAPPLIPVSTSGLTMPHSEQPALIQSGPLQSGIEYYQEAYRIKPGDQLSVTLIGANISGRKGCDETSYSDSVVLPDGSAIIPPFGVIQAGGKTFKEVNTELSQGIQQYYRFAHILVHLSKTAQR